MKLVVLFLAAILLNGGTFALTPEQKVKWQEVKQQIEEALDKYDEFIQEVALSHGTYPAILEECSDGTMKVRTVRIEDDKYVVVSEEEIDCETKGE